jgi:RNA polymerase sigma factor (sigma-70 family)
METSATVTEPERKPVDLSWMGVREQRRHQRYKDHMTPERWELVQNYLPLIDHIYKKYFTLYTGIVLHHLYEHLFENLMYAAVTWKPEEKCAFKTWAYYILHQKGLCFLKRRANKYEWSNSITRGKDYDKNSNHVLDTSIPYKSNDFKTLETTETIEAVYRAVKKLPKADRILFKGWIRGDSVKKVASKEKVSTQAVNIRRKKMKRKLMAELCKMGLTA